jgi:predicted ribonuclease YlaK
VVPLIVVHELDALKYQNSTRDAARSALRWLYGSLPRDPARRAAITDGTLEVLVHDGPLRVDPDAVVIDVARWLGTVGTTPVRLVTRDLAMRVRAQAAGVQVAYLDGDRVSPAPPVP